MNLTINHSSSSTEDITVCDSYFWNGEFYTTSGEYSYNTTTVNGCDSTATLSLTINNSSSSSESITACDSFEWNGEVYTESGEYTYNTTTVNGCDSTATLVLTINSSSSTVEEAVACDSFEWNGEIYTESGEYTYNTTTVNGCDSVVTLTLTINNSSSSFEEVVSCDSYLWNGEFYTTSGEYSYNTTTVNGCDSTATLSLTINNSSSSSESITACDSFEWNGEVYTESGEYTYNTTTVNGCDSTATLVLTINSSSSTVEEAVACDSFEWNGEIYTESGEYTYNTTTVNGCDSVVTLTLTINNSSSSFEEVVSCDSYLWNGEFYTTSGEYSYNTTTVNGCDSTATLSLTINNSSSSSESITACDSFEWNGEVYTESGEYTYNTTTVNGCDSTATLVLTINSSSSTVEEAVACDSFEWNGEIYTESGEYTYNTTTVNGCDSVVTLTLTINNSSSSFEEVVSCDSYLWNGEFYTTSGEYSYNTTTVNGCDSTATLSLTINNSSSSSESITACDSFEWNGEVYTESGEYTYNTTTVNGCDSTATLVLTINSSSSTVEEAVACDSFEWNGEIYTESGEYTYNTTTVNGCDSVVTLTLTINNSSSSFEEVVSCDSYLWNGEFYTTSGEYSYNTTTVNGCDSTATLSLTINNSSSSSESITACDSFEWNGEVYTESGEYTYNTTTVNGCDSTATLVLTINSSSSTVEEAVACDSFEWNGEIYTESGEYTYNTTTVNGCDSVVTLTLTINNSSSSFEEVVSCDSYLWNGEFYTTSGEYSYNTTTVNGCDSTATLSLTINNSSSSSESITACDSFEWNGEVYTESGEYTYNTTTVNGCDSTATLVLTINSSSSTVEEAVACDSFEWNGEIYTESGEYTYNTTTVNGCDSVVTLTLTINNSSSSFEEVVSCDSYLWNGEFYTTSGEYSYNTTTVNGCDSTATLSLTINNSSSSSESITACDSFEWNGEVYTESGEYTYNTTTVNGCDSTATLVLTINSSSSTVEEAVACDSFEWNGEIYTESGEYTYNTTTVNGCDSVVTLTLTINNSSSSFEEVVSCDSYLWNGEFYTTSGEYSYNTTTVNGCDSTATLSLTINNSSSSSESITACDSFEWNGEVYTESGEYTYNTTTVNGCDSTATLVLTINSSSSTVEEAVACDSFEWNGEIYTESGEYTYNTTTVNGCDSVVTLTLTINNSSHSSESVITCDSYEWNGTLFTESGEYTFESTNVYGCDSTATLVLTINTASTFDLTVSDISTAGALISWETSEFLYYDIQYYLTDDQSSPVDIVNLEENEIELSDLFDGQDYTFNITAYDENGCSFTTDVSFETLLSCNAPLEVEFDFTSTTATITWDGSLTNATSYEIYYYLPFEGWNFIIVNEPILEVDYSISGTLQLYIKSVCEDYISSWSNLFSDQLPTCDLELTATVTTASCTDSLGSVTLNVEGSNGDYFINTNQLDPSSLELGTYTFTVTDEIGCTDSIQFDIELQESIQVSASASSSLICVGEQSILSASEDFSSYQWYDADSDQIIGTGQSYSTSIAGNYYVVAQDVNGCTSTSDNIEVSQVLVEAVTELSVNNLTSNYASLDWNDASQSGMYTLEYSSDGGNTWTTIEEVQGSSINLSDLSSYTTYDVLITSVSYGCESESYASSFTTLAECTTPENITVSATADEVTLSWDPVFAAQSYQVVYYVPSTGWVSETVTDTFVTASHSSEGGYAYFYVRSNCGVGITSSYSDLYFIELPDCDIDLSITSLSTTFCIGESVNLSVSSDFLSYQWYVDGEAIDGATTSSFVASESGDYTVVVTNSLGCSVTSDELSITQTIVEAVSSVEVYNLTSSYATIDWNDASQSGMYTLEYSSDGGNTWTTIEEIQGSSINLSDLSSYTTYDVLITSVSYGCESESYASSFTTLAECTTPENITVSATADEVTLSWDPVFAAQSYQVVYYVPSTGWVSETVTDTFVTASHSSEGGYAYFYVRSNCGVGITSSYSDLYFIELPDCDIDLSITSLSTTFCIGESVNLSVSSDFLSYQWYVDGEAIDGATTSSYVASESGDYTVVVTNSLGCSVTSDELSITQTIVEAVSSVEVYNLTSSYATIDWNDASQSGMYTLEYSSDGGNTWTTIEEIQGSSINLSDLSSYTTYDVLITSVSYGCESESYASSFTTLAECTTPENITVSATADEVTLSWDPVFAAQSYKVVYYVPSTGWVSETVTDTFITVSHSSEGGYAYFYVRSNCGVGITSSYSDLYFIELPDCDVDVSITSSFSSFCAGESLAMSVSSDYLTFQWYLDEEAIDGATDFSYLAVSGGHYTVVVTDAFGCQITSEELQVTEISLSSSSIEVSDITTTTVDLQWDNVSEIEEYAISYSTDGGLTYTSLSDAFEGTEVTLTGLSPFTTYDVLITSVSYSCETYVANFTTLADCVPPSNISMSTTADEVTLSWDAVLGATSYKVVYYVPSTGWVSETVTDTFITVSHSSDGGYAYFYVRSNCGEGITSSYSDLYFIELPDCDVDVSITSSFSSFCAGESLAMSVSSDYLTFQWYLDEEAIDGATDFSYSAVSGGHYTVVVTDAFGCQITSEELQVTEISLSSSSIEVSDITTTTVDLQWDNVSEIEEYAISYSTDGGLTYTSLSDAFEGTEVTLTGLSPFTTYDVLITSVSYSCETYVANFTTLADCVPPSNISMSTTADEVTLSWDAVLGATSYKVVYYVPSTGWVSETVTDTFITVSHSSDGGYAYFYVRSNCGEGITSSYSDLYFIELPDCDIDVSIDSESTSFCFGESVNLSVSSDFLSYQWYVDGEAIDGATTSSFVASESGDYTVVVTNSLGCSVTSDELSITQTIVEAVSSVEVYNLTSSYATIDWNDASQSGMYTLEYSSDGGNTWTTIEEIQGSSINLSDLSSYTTYDVLITSVSYGCESESYASSFTTLAECTTPENITVSATADEVTLSWDPVFAAQSYKVVYYVPSTGWVSETVTDTFITVSHSSEGSYAYFYVRSNCGVGITSSYSDLYFIELPDCDIDVSIDSESTSFCFGESIELSASSTFTTYQWYLDGVQIDGATSATFEATESGQYSLKVSNEIGCLATSSAIDVSETIIEPVSEIEFNNITTSYVSVDWDNTSLSGMYEFEFSSDGGNTWSTFEEVQGSSINLSNLSPNTTYELLISAVSFGCKSEAYSAQFTTEIECLSPTNISVDNTTSSATISWDENSFAESYEVLYNFGDGFATVSTTSNSITLDMGAASSYDFYVRTICDGGLESEWSDLQSFTVSCDEPSNISFINDGTNLTIDWDGNAPEYWLIYNYGSGWTYAYPTESEITISDVPVGSTIYIYLRALCDVDNNFVSSWASDVYTTVSGGKIAQMESPEFEVYPNPTSGKVTISFVDEQMADRQLLIIDAYGKEVYREQISSEIINNQFIIDLSNYSKGVYIVKILSDNATFTRRLILQ